MPAQLFGNWASLLECWGIASADELSRTSQPVLFITPYRSAEPSRRRPASTISREKQGRAGSFVVPARPTLTSLPLRLVAVSYLHLSNLFPVAFIVTLYERLTISRARRPGITLMARRVCRPALLGILFPFIFALPIPHLLLVGDRVYHLRPEHASHGAVTSPARCDFDQRMRAAQPPPRGSLSGEPVSSLRRTKLLTVFWQTPNNSAISSWE